MNVPNGSSNHDRKALNIMHKMGYEDGSGLGKHKDGIINPITIQEQTGRNGFGSSSKFNSELWNYDFSFKEDLIWLKSPQEMEVPLKEWIVRGFPISSLYLETNFCNEHALTKVLKTKENVFTTLDATLLSKARMRANPFEAVRSAFFMNRAALKMANIDAICDFMFTNVDKNPVHKQNVDPYYFADVCAGPGGFSEYVLWRKRWSFKGFGFTLKGNHDFKLDASWCASDATFRPYYGSANDGDVCNPENIADFAQKVLRETDNKGVHFMMSDGGFSVDGNEYLQEILSKQIYICQCLVALEIVRANGHFVTKLFDIFSGFSVGLLFLVHFCFDKISILKPNSSRPANSERYLICSSLKSLSAIEKIRDYLRNIVKDLWKNRNVDRSNNCNDLIEIVPLDVIQRHSDFYEFIRKHNETFAVRQTKNLLKLAAFCKNVQLFEEKQSVLRSKSLEFWRIPDRKREHEVIISPDKLLASYVNKPEFLFVPSDKICSHSSMEKSILDPLDWIYLPLNSSQRNDNCYIFAGVNASKVYKLHHHKWIKVRNLKLAKGTILYGELVTEFDKSPSGKCEIKCLHVIDALRLGETSLADLPFDERRELINIYCKAVTFETVDDVFQVKPKIFDSLSNITHQSIINYNVLEDVHYTMYPHENRKYFNVNSLLLLKSDINHLFNSTYVLRVQLFINKFENDDESSTNTTYEDFLKFLQCKLI